MQCNTWKIWMFFGGGSPEQNQVLMPLVRGYKFIRPSYNGPIIALEQSVEALRHDIGPLAGRQRFSIFS